MILNLIVEGKNFESDKEFFDTISKSPCTYCLFGKGMSCVERKHCRWDSHKEIFVKKEVVETKQ